jgi:hypothetical protein
MQETIRLRIDAGGRALEFCHTHPDPDPGTVQVVDRLGILMDRSGSLALQQRSNLATVAAAISAKTELRVTIGNELASLFGVAKSAAVAHPDLAVHRRLPPARTNEKTLLTLAGGAVTEATAAREQLIPCGLRDGMLAGLQASIDAYEAETTRQRNALAAQVGASADLKVVTSDIIKVLKNLDAIHKVRFVKDPEMKAAWKSARNVAWRNAEPEVPVDPTTPGAVQSDAA